MTAQHKISHSPTLQQIPRRGTLIIWGFGSHLRVQHGQLEAEWGIGEERCSVRLPRVDRNLKRVIVVGSDGFASFDAMRWIADVGASLSFIDRRGKLLFVSGPTAPNDSKLRRAQSLALGNGIALKISKELISNKIEGQAALVRDMLGNTSAADAILRFRGEVAAADSLNNVRILEAQAAKNYWSQWANVQIRWPKQDEHRVPDHWKKFGSRISPLTHSPRSAANAPNACMNLLHALCEAECRIALIGMGLDPDIGLLHVDAPNRSSLANDLQEVLRPKVDAFVLNWIQTEAFRKADFLEDRTGNCRIASTLAAKLCGTSRTWYRLVAPWAEYAAQELWNSIRRTTPSTRAMATRLTQSTKRTVKGSAVPAVNMPKHDHVCSGCGKPIRSDRTSCVNCWKAETVKEFEVGRKLGQSSNAIAKRADTMRQHRKRISEWKPSSIPSWLTREVYTEQVRPALSNVAKSRIRAALGVSEPYASFIQTGKRIPHIRHWLALAKLAAVFCSI